MKKWKRIIMAAVLLLIAAMGYMFLIHNDKAASDFQIGKTPGCYQCTFGEDYLLFKEDVWEDGEPKYQGLYYKNLNEELSEAAVLLSDNFYACANVYQDHVIFIDCDDCISKVDLKGEDSEILVDNGGTYISDALVIGDVLYYLTEAEENETNENTLYALDLNTKQTKQLVNHVNYRYLYHYNGMAGVISREDDELLACSMEDGVVQKFNDLEYEIMGFLDDGTVICYGDGTIYTKTNPADKKSLKLLEMEDIYRIIVHPDEMLICTIDGYGLIEVFIYNFEKEKLDKIANANTVPRDFNEQYVVCQSELEGVGTVELIDRKNGDIVSLRIDDDKNEKTAETDTADVVGEKGNSGTAGVEETDLNSGIQEAMENYFDDFLDTLLETDDRDYTSEDFATINGYIAAKRLVVAREKNKISLGGICAVDLGEVVLNDVAEKSDSMEAEVCVNYEYSWGNGTAEETCKVSSLYRVYLEQIDGDYKVIDLDEFDNVEIKMAKDAIKDTEEIEAQYQMIDNYYDTQIQNAKDLSGL